MTLSWIFCGDTDKAVVQKQTKKLGGGRASTRSVDVGSFDIVRSKVVTARPYLVRDGGVEILA